jgi:hypothetical protein
MKRLHRNRFLTFFCASTLVERDQGRRHFAFDFDFDFAVVLLSIFADLGHRSSAFFGYEICMHRMTCLPGLFLSSYSSLACGYDGGADVTITTSQLLEVSDAASRIPYSGAKEESVLWKHSGVVLLGTLVCFSNAFVLEVHCSFNASTSYVDHVLAVKALPGTPAAILGLIKIWLPKYQRPILALRACHMLADVVALQTICGVQNRTGDELV